MHLDDYNCVLCNLAVEETLVHPFLECVVHPFLECVLLPDPVGKLLVW